MYLSGVSGHMCRDERGKNEKGAQAQANNVPESVPEVSAEIKSEIMSFFPVGN